MKSKCLLVVRVAALVFPLACSGNAPDHAPGDDRLFVPEDLPNTLWEGEEGVGLKLVAFTLVQGPNGPELYNAVRNDGDTPSCSPGIATDFFDKAGETVTSVATDLRTNQLYMFRDVVIACVGPGQTVMSAATNLPGVVIGELGRLKHRFPTFGLGDLVPVAGVSVGQVETIVKGAGGAYKGTVTNGLDLTVTAPAVMIFPVNRVGRPLGVATSSATIDLPPGGSWSFETTTVSDLGVDYAAYPAFSLP